MMLRRLAGDKVAFWMWSQEHNGNARPPLNLRFKTKKDGRRRGGRATNPSEREQPERGFGLQTQRLTFVTPRPARFR